jgi:hypothetical protein
MILGISLSTYTLIHVLLSLAGIFTGAIMVWGLLNAKMLDGWVAIFFATSVPASMTGFYFPSPMFGLSQAVDIISLTVLAVAILALYAYRLAGPWRQVYVLGVILALYLNVFMGVVQIFRKVAFLRALAPTQTEWPFIGAQLIVMAIFMTIGIVAVKSFHPDIKFSGPDIE